MKTSMLCLAVVALVGSSAAGQTRRATTTAASTASARVAPVAIRSLPARGTSGLTTEQQLQLFKELGGVVLDQAALNEPVRLTPREPSHLDRVFVEVNMARAVTGAPGGWGPDKEGWMLIPAYSSYDTTSLTVFVAPAVRTRPVLVDCLVQVDPSANYPESRIFVYASNLEHTIEVTAAPAHISAVLPPASPGISAEALRINLRMGTGGRKTLVRYCDVTALK